MHTYTLKCIQYKLYHACLSPYTPSEEANPPSIKNNGRLDEVIAVMKKLNDDGQWPMPHT